MYQWTFRRVMGATLLLVLVGLSFWLLYRFNQVVFILFVSILIGTVIRPVVAWLNRRGPAPHGGGDSVSFVLLALLIGFVLLLFPLLVDQSTTIAAAVPGHHQGLREWMVRSSQPIDCTAKRVPSSNPTRPADGTTNGRAGAGFCRSGIW